MQWDGVQRNAEMCVVMFCTRCVCSKGGVSVHEQGHDVIRGRGGRGLPCATYGARAKAQVSVVSLKLYGGRV